MRVGKSNNPYRLTVETKHLAWQAQADCVTTDPEGFFPDGPADSAVLGVCLRCPVIGQCLEYALAHPELGGIWAATTAEQRKRLRRLRERAAS
jgi:WhiB family redox-sensing transcriptional regulator